jgi:hypothetical protein
VGVQRGKRKFRLSRYAAVLMVLLGVQWARAGAPYVTDDPDPTDFKHWEIDFFSIYTHTAGEDADQLPAVEMDYGLIPDMEIHAIAPMVYDRVPGGRGQYGYGDTELGANYRFFHETDDLPEMSVYPLVEVPTGDSGRGLGNGQTQVFTPIWIQKSFGKDNEWTTFGGGGYWYNPGEDHRNYYFVGWALQRDLNEALSLGGEVFHETPMVSGGHGHTAFDLGCIWNLDEHNHVLLSAGRDIDGPNRFLSYLGYQWTF